MLSLSNSIQLNTVDLTVEILHSQNIRVCRNTAMQLMGRDHPTQIKESVNTSPFFFAQRCFQWVSGYSREIEDHHSVQIISMRQFVG